MTDDHSGYIWDVKQPTRDGFVACLVITPLHKGGGADTGAKMERSMGCSTALQIAEQMLEACGVPADLLARVRELRAAAGRSGIRAEPVAAADRPRD